MDKKMSIEEVTAHRIAGLTKMASTVNTNLPKSIAEAYSFRNRPVIARNKKGDIVIESYKIATNKGFEVVKFIENHDIDHKTKTIKL